MASPGYHRFGSLTSPSGAMYVITDKEGSIAQLADVYGVCLEKQGIAVTPEIRQEVLRYCRSCQEDEDRRVDSLGIPKTFQELLSFTKKSKLVAYCRRISVSEDDLYALIHNCAQIGLNHRAKFREFVPEARQLLDSDIRRMRLGDARQFRSKVARIFAERKRYHVHLLEGNKVWHCFYYTYRDMESSKEMHWKHGSHLHYVSHLWPNVSKRQVWDSFDRRDVSIEGVHIRLQTFRYGEATNAAMTMAFSASVAGLLAKLRRSPAA